MEYDRNILSANIGCGNARVDRVLSFTTTKSTQGGCAPFFSGKKDSETRLINLLVVAAAFFSSPKLTDIVNVLAALFLLLGQWRCRCAWCSFHHRGRWGSHVLLRNRSLRSSLLLRCSLRDGSSRSDAAVGQPSLKVINLVSCGDVIVLCDVCPLQCRICAVDLRQLRALLKGSRRTSCLGCFHCFHGCAYFVCLFKDNSRGSIVHNKSLSNKSYILM
jgi:hypothetical protein